MRKQCCLNVLWNLSASWWEKETPQWHIFQSRLSHKVVWHKFPRPLCLSAASGAQQTCTPRVKHPQKDSADHMWPPPHDLQSCILQHFNQHFLSHFKRNGIYGSVSGWKPDSKPMTTRFRFLVWSSLLWYGRSPKITTMLNDIVVLQHSDVKNAGALPVWKPIMEEKLTGISNIDWVENAILPSGKCKSWNWEPTNNKNMFWRIPGIKFKVFHTERRRECCPHLFCKHACEWKWVWELIGSIFHVTVGF